MNETLLLALALIPALVLAIVFHEVAHGWTALALGDPTAKEARRLSLNPIRHVDPIGTIVLPGFPLLFLLLLVIPWLFPELGIIERIVLPPVEWARGQYMHLALAIAGA